MDHKDKEHIQRISMKSFMRIKKLHFRVSYKVVDTRISCWHSLNKS